METVELFLRERFQAACPYGRFLHFAIRKIVTYLRVGAHGGERWFCCRWLFSFSFASITYQK